MECGEDIKMSRLHGTMFAHSANLDTLQHNRSSWHVREEESMEQRHVPVTAFWALPDDFYACSKQRLGDEASVCVLFAILHYVN